MARLRRDASAFSGNASRGMLPRSPRPASTTPVPALPNAVTIASSSVSILRSGVAWVRVVGADGHDGEMRLERQSVGNLPHEDVIGSGAADGEAQQPDAVLEREPARDLV